MEFLGLIPEFPNSKLEFPDSTLEFPFEPISELEFLGVPTSFLQTLDAEFSLCQLNLCLIFISITFH
jgi:hypothetical protein